MREIEAFLAANPSEIVTLILEDYVETPNGLPKLFNDSGLTKYWFPVSSMPQNGQDWPLVSDMVASNQRLIVFTSIKSKQDSEGIAYQWNYMVENQCKQDLLSPHLRFCSWKLYHAMHHTGVSFLEMLDAFDGARNDRLLQTPYRGKEGIHVTSS